MRALVTGAAGFIGHHLVRELLDRNWDVRAVDDLSTGDQERIDCIQSGRSFTFQKGSVEDASLVGDLVDGCDVVFHQAAIPSVPRSWTNPIDVTRSNCLGTSVLLEQAKGAGVSRIVVASSSSVYGEQTPGMPKEESMCPNPQSPYALTKLWTERLTLQYGVQYDIGAVALRYFNIFGPGQGPFGEYAAVIPKFIAQMTNNERPTIYGDGEQTRDFTYIENAVAANLAALDENVPTGVYNVGTGERHSVNELVYHLNELMGTNMEPVYEEERPGDVRHSLASLDKARNVLDYRPTVDFREGLRRTVSWFNRG